MFYLPFTSEELAIQELNLLRTSEELAIQELNLPRS
jgi:hypothetical protein